MKPSRSTGESPKRRPTEPKRNDANGNGKKGKTESRNKEHVESIQAGKIGTFLSRKLSDDVLLGQIPTAIATDDAVYANLDCIARFLADYRAMSALHGQEHGQEVRQSSTNTGRGDNGDAPRQENDSDSNSNSNSNNSWRRSHPSTAYFMPAIQEFGRSQNDRQSAGLRTNTSAQTAEGMANVVSAHARALEAAMAHADSFQSNRFYRFGGNDDDAETDHLIPSKQTLCEWHAILYSYSSKQRKIPRGTRNRKAASAVNPEPVSPSSFRTSGARAGSTHFCPASQIADEFRRFRSCLIEICLRWEERILAMPEHRRSSADYSAHGSEGASPEAGATSRTGRRLTPQHASIYHAVAVAAIFMYGLMDIHLFSDGNGRLARIGANWILKRTLGWPFTITLTASPQQRRDYVQALKKGRDAVNGMPQKRRQPREEDAKADAKPTASEASSGCGVFRPIVHFVLDHVASAVRECQRKLEEESLASMTAEEDRIARKVRSRVAAGACIICLDENPNMATLCCGQGVHLNCIAEWLANNSTCAYCRAPLPRLNVRRPTAAPARMPPGETEFPDDSNGTTEASWTTDEAGYIQVDVADFTTEDTESTDDSNGTTDETTLLAGIVDDLSGTSDESTEETESSLDSAGTTTGGTIDLIGITDDSGGSTDDTNSGTLDLWPQQQSQRCLLCNNIAAEDCSNRMCGRCCVMDGTFPCRRHNSLY